MDNEPFEISAIRNVARRGREMAKGMALEDKGYKKWQTYAVFSSASAAIIPIIVAFITENLLSTISVGLAVIIYSIIGVSHILGEISVKLGRTNLLLLDATYSAAMEMENEIDNDPSGLPIND